MNIITNRKVDFAYSNIDSSNKESVKSFQSWFNLNFAKPPFTNKPLVVDGIYGPNTKKAYDMYGGQFEKTISDTIKSAEKIELQAPKKSIYDRFNEFSTAKKVSVIALGAILIAVVAYVVIPKKGKK